MISQSLYEKVGGRTTLEKVHKIFYDKIYEHSWLKIFFKGIDQQHIEDQQSDFMSSLMGGPRCFSGVMPRMAHKRMFISQEIMDIRSNLLRESMLEYGVSKDLINAWILKDKSQHFGIIKKLESEAQPRYDSEVRLVVPKPR